LFDKATGKERMTEIEVEEERYIKEVVWKHKEVYSDLFEIDDYITLQVALEVLKDDNTDLERVLLNS
jgi:hypothetical protein